MTLFRFLWAWLNSPHCVCGCKDNAICYKFDDGHLDGTCCMCDHIETCHQLNGAQK